VIAEYGETVGEVMRTVAVGENAGQADDHRGEQDDEPQDDDHVMLREYV
jgi:hypothetical protein